MPEFEVGLSINQFQASELGMSLSGELRELDVMCL
jgi:hypothetical protein